MKLPQKGKTSFTFTFFPPEEIDKRYSNIIARCSGLTDHEQIARIIHSEFHNQMFLTMQLDTTFKMYRVTIPYEGLNPRDQYSFAHPPPDKAALNRANLTNHPVFYGSLLPIGAFREMKDLLQEGKEFYISEWEVNPTLPVFAHSIMINSRTSREGSPLYEIASGQIDKTLEMLANAPEHARDGLRRYLERVGDIFSLEDKEYYNITSAYAHQVLYEMRRLKAVTQMLIYPSVVDHNNLFNYAVHPDFVKSPQMKLTTVFKLVVDKIHTDSIRIKTSARGKNTGQDIEWFQPRIIVDKLDYQNAVVHTHDACVFVGNEALKMTVNNSELTVEQILRDNMNKYLMECLGSIPFEDDIFSFESGKRNHIVTMQCNHGWKLATGKDHGCINTISVPVYWREAYAPINQGPFQVNC